MVNSLNNDWQVSYLLFIKSCTHYRYLLAKKAFTYKHTVVLRKKLVKKLVINFAV
jgi:hypothetical protein